MATSSLSHENTRVAIYGRVSTKDKGQEVENQLRQLREFSSSQGWIICREFVDHETGSTNDRTAFQAMFKDASQRKFDVLLFWALDHLSREGVLETLQHLNRLTSYGVGYRSFTEQYFDTCGIFKDAVIATVAKQERVRISLRVRAGLELAREKGKRIGRPPRRCCRQRRGLPSLTLMRAGELACGYLLSNLAHPWPPFRDVLGYATGRPARAHYLPNS